MTTPPRRVTLRDIARRAGVHFSTVSLALRNHPRLPRATCERVKNLALEMGYVPDPMLASLSSYRNALRPVDYHATLAWVTSFPTREGWREFEIFREHREGAGRRAEELGYRLEDFWIREPGLSASRATGILRARNIGGLVIAPLPEPQGSIEIDWGRFSSVAMGYSLVSPLLHNVSAHQYRCIRLAMAKVAERGYERPGLVTLRSSDDRVDHKWLAGYLVAEYEKPEALRVPPLLLPRWDHAAFEQWLEQSSPDVIITKCSEVVPSLARLGVEVPREIGVVSIAPVDKARILSGVNENPRLVGAAAVDYLVGMIHRNERGCPTVQNTLLIEGTWVEGHTLRPSRRARRIRRVPIGG